MSTANAKPKPDIAKVEQWLGDHHKLSVEDLAPLMGGYWSSAYSYTVGENKFVLRLGESGDGYLIDEKAYQFNGPMLPVPHVVDRGEALGLAYAISNRHYGQFIETVAEKKAQQVGLAMDNLLQAMRAITPASVDQAVWYDPVQSDLTWHKWLLGSLTDRPDSHTAGWRRRLAAKPALDNLFNECDARIRALLPECPSRGDLVHGDLLHQNVLVNDAADKVTAVFSWKCSARGDFLYDVAWCTVWSPWHPVIDTADIWTRVLAADDLSEADLKNAAIRHHCYELQIAASHMGWYAWTEDEENMASLVKVITLILHRGPLTI